MGNDGGSIPKRRELVKEAARNPTATEIKESQHEQQEYYWTTDPLSRKPLTRPIVSDSNGKLYNKDSIIEYLLPSDDGTSKAEAENILQGSVKTLKDVVEIKLEVDEEATKHATATGSLSKEIWKCPITSDRLGPGSKAVYLVPCGHAFSATAIKEVSGEKCLQCDTSYAPNDVIPILSTAATDIARLSLRIKTLREQGLTHSLKKSSKESKKRKKRDDKDETVTATVETRTNSHEGSESATPRTGTHAQDKDANGGIHNASTRALTDKVLQEQETKKKRRMLESENVKSLFSSRDQSKPIGKSSDCMVRGYTIPANAKR